jgi:hypothetical protein
MFSTAEIQQFRTENTVGRVIIPRELCLAVMIYTCMWFTGKKKLL